ncbi:MAG: HDIG domain-containing protein [Actinobacteria bacterium]|nr:HDIG domain-containing protein [Actinomycetota bacterium]MBU1492696.1 HDIG domain-containing protein [Actinomycetota bacterium]
MALATRVLSGLVRPMVIAATIILASLILVVGQGEEVDPIRLVVEQPSPQTFTSTEAVTVVDAAATQARREAAAAAIPEVYTEDPDANTVVLAGIQGFFSDAEAGAQPVYPEPVILTVPTDPPFTTSTSTTSTSSTTTTTQPTGTTTEGEESTTTSSTTTTSTTTTTTLPPPLPREDQIVLLRDAYPLLKTASITAIVDVLNDDLERALNGEQQFFDLIENEALALAGEQLQEGILATELEGVRTGLVTRPPTLILLRDLPEDQRDLVDAAVADLVAVNLQANRFFDRAETDTQRAEAAAAVVDETVVFVPGQTIVQVGQLVTEVQLDAITQLGLLTPPVESPPLQALAVLAALVTLIAAVYLWRVGSEHWSRPKLVVLLGLLIVLAAAVARLPEFVTRDRIELGFLLPAALFGYLAAHLYGARIALLIAMPVGAFTALATGDVALAVYAITATLLPIPLVSSISTRAQLNLAVVYSALLHVPLAAAIAWWFYGTGSIVWSTVFGFGSGVISGVVALGVLPLVAGLFGVTTTQTLLDLTDRNHPALRLIEEEAPGTFNHSIVVGSLAGKAARAIGGNPLLAQAMAYYHDLGKTVSPQYFVENQFGVSNPHDDLPPEESAAIIRSHVAEGLRLARQYRIPPDVTHGILTHHGTSLMRYFYHKAIDRYGDRDVNPIDYRHRGRKPRGKEMVIVMLADASEAATRSMVQHEDPTSEGIRTLVEGIIAEKVEDGQLEESEVTFGELTRIKEAFVDALIGYYHTRIPYPGFPPPRSGPAT